MHHDDLGGLCRHYMTLYSVVLGLETRTALELGAGFSTRVILSALAHTGGRLFSIDVRPLRDTGNDPRFLAAYAQPWTYLQGDSRDMVEKLGDEVFEFVLHDGSHEPEIVQADLEAILPRMKKNAILLVHDTEHPIHDYGLAPACQRALRDVGHSTVTLPFGFGLTVVRVEEDFGHVVVETSWHKRPSV